MCYRFDAYDFGFANNIMTCVLILWWLDLFNSFFSSTQAQEWVVVNHDAAYQTLFSVIGQNRMAQNVREAHALHTFLGRTGCVPGFSLQQSLLWSTVQGKFLGVVHRG